MNGWMRRCRGINARLKSRRADTDLTRDRFVAVYELVVIPVSQSSVVMTNIAAILSAHGRYDDAVAQYRLVLLNEKRAVGTDSIPVAATMYALAATLFKLEKFEEALDELNVAHAIYELLTKGVQGSKSVVQLQNKCIAMNINLSPRQNAKCERMSGGDLPPGWRKVIALMMKQFPNAS